MKNFLLTMMLVSGYLLSLGQATFENFEDQRRGVYDFTSGIFVPYVENPDTMGNTSAVVGMYTRNAVETFDVLVIDGDSLFENLADYVSGAKTLSIDVWSPDSGITVQITLEDSSKAGATNFPDGRHSVYLTETTKDSAWETLTFTFDNRPDPSVSDDSVGRLILLFAPDTNTDGGYFFDNLNAPAFANDACSGATAKDSVANDFECNQNVNITFTHGSLRRIPNPDPSGLNQSGYVGSYTRSSAEEFDVIVGDFRNELAFSADSNVFTLMVWDANPNTVVRLSLQSDGQDVVATADSTTQGSQWQQLVFRFGDLTGLNVNSFVILFDPGNFTSDQYFWDDFALVTGGSLLNVERVIGEGSLVAYPNPSQGMATFSYELTKASEISLSVFDMAGREVSTLSQGVKGVGKHSLQWNAEELQNGLYFYQFKANEQVLSGKIVLNK